MIKIILIIFTISTLVSCKTSGHGCDAYGLVKQKEIKKIS
jgi:hypothetical protein